MLRSATDEDLIRASAKGNSFALEELYARYSKRLLNYFNRMLWQDEEKAQDFLQDLFLKVVEHAPTFDGRRFSTWIFSIASNMCKNEYRRMTVRKQAHFVDYSYVMENTTDIKIFQKYLAQVVALLDDDSQELYNLRYEIEMSIEDIAGHLDCPQGTVKSRLFYLRKHLCKELKVFRILINEL